MNIVEHSLRLAFDPLYSSLAGSLAVQIPYDQRKEVLPPSTQKIAPVFQSNATGNGQHQAGQHQSSGRRKKEPVMYRPKKNGDGAELVSMEQPKGRISIRV